MDDLAQSIQASSAEHQELPRLQLSQTKLAAKVSFQTADQREDDHHQRMLDFSLAFFSSDGTNQCSDKYALLIEAVKFADTHGFTAVWTPERHFQAFGGLYPNPSVLGAALATITRRLRIRAGSVVLPLHSTLRVAEEWAVVDNLSQGRVGLSLATGWHPGDFVIAPQQFERRRLLMLRELAILRRLWRGEAISYPDGLGQMTSIRILPRPIQPELPLWITSSGNPATWEAAGEQGTGVFSSLMGETLETLTKKIERYRTKLAQHHPNTPSHIALMLHTFVGEDDEKVRELVRPPLLDYLRTFVAQDTEVNGSTHHFEVLVNRAFERYFTQSALLGSIDKCQQLLDKLVAIGVNEVACLVDFGLEPATVLEGLQRLDCLLTKYKPLDKAGVYE